MLLKKLVLLPPIDVTPLNITIPPFALKAPELSQTPPTPMLPVDAVKLPVMSMLLNELVLLPLIVVVPSKVTVPPFALNAPELDQFPITFIFALGAINVPAPVIVTLLNVSVLLPEIAVEPSNVTVPPFALNVPALAQLPATFMFPLGAVRVLEAAMTILPKERLPLPLITVEPSKVTVPPFPLNVPALTQRPPISRFPGGAVRALAAAIEILLKEFMLAPLIVVVPLNVTVPPLALKVPALTQLPATFMFPLGAVRLLDAPISMPLKESSLLPLIVVVPSNVTVPLFALKVPELIQLPESIRFPLGAVNIPDVRTT